MLKKRDQSAAIDMVTSRDGESASNVGVPAVSIGELGPIAGFAETARSRALKGDNGLPIGDSTPRIKKDYLCTYNATNLKLN
jgi:hypothetical protein